MDSTVAYKDVLEQIMHAQIQILGYDVCVAKAKHVSGLEVDASGRVLSVSGDASEVMMSLVRQFAELSPVVIKRTLESVMLSGREGSQVTTTEVMHQAHLDGSPAQDNPAPVYNEEVVMALQNAAATLH